MNILQDDPTGIPEEQIKIQAKCFHPSGTFKEFEKQDIEQSIIERFEQQVDRYPDRLAIKTENYKMKLLLYYSEDNSQTHRLDNLIQSFVPDGSVEIFRTMEDLIVRFKKPVGDIAAAVFVASDMVELENFYTLRNYFFDLRHIIILPEKDEEMITVAHKLRPRFLSYFEHDFNVVAAVLKKIFSPESTVKNNFEDVMSLESTG